MGWVAILLRPGKEHTGGSSDLLGKVKTGEASRAEGTDRAGRSMDRAAEEGAGRDCSGKEFATVRESRGEEIMNRRVCRKLLHAGMLLVPSMILRLLPTFHRVADSYLPRHLLFPHLTTPYL